MKDHLVKEKWKQLGVERDAKQKVNQWHQSL